MYWKKYLTGGVVLGVSSLISCNFAARADVYHAVSKGETLRAVAERYHTSPATLRAANVLQNLADDAQLPLMLLRVPDENSAAPKTRNIAQPQQNQTAATGWGKISATTTYKVRAGDSWETIATQYTQSGYILTADMLRQENPGVELATNSTLTVPLNRIVYNAVAKTSAPQTARSQATDLSVGAPSIVPVGDDDWSAAPAPDTSNLPVARVVNEESNKPARYAQRIIHAQQTVTPRAEKEEEKPQHRGPSVLGSRGGPGAAREGVQILESGEAAVVSPPASQPRVIRPNVQEEEPQPEQQTAKVARVAKIIKNSARIRRLPENGAATLYNTPAGTELAVIGSQGSWVSILMSDRSTGWLPAHYVSFTGARVDISSIKTHDPGTSSTRTLRSSTTGDMSRYAAASPVVANALKWIGTPYVWGGTSRRGVDCSGLVMNAYRACGVSLPRVSRDQAKVGRSVATEDLQAGDRLYFSASGRRIDHTGIYMGDGLFVHASGGGRRVMVSRLFDRGNWNIFVGARR